MYKIKFLKQPNSNPPRAELGFRACPNLTRWWGAGPGNKARTRNGGPNSALPIHKLKRRKGWGSRLYVGYELILRILSIIAVPRNLLISLLVHKSPIHIREWVQP